MTTVFLQLMGNAGNTIVFNYKKFSSTEEIDNARNLLLKSNERGPLPKSVNINGIPFERIFGQKGISIGKRWQHEL